MFNQNWSFKENRRKALDKEKIRLDLTIIFDEEMFMSVVHNDRPHLQCGFVNRGLLALKVFKSKLENLG